MTPGMATTSCCDAISVNVHTLPGGQHAGYTTGSGGIGWTAAQFNNDPGAIRICQDGGATDITADVLDVESGAATVQDTPGWVTRARAAYAAGTRPGQRYPMVYSAGGTLTPIANELAAAGIKNVPIWLADPGIPAAEAVAKINSASGSYPLVGVQFAWPGLGLPGNGSYDVSEFNTAWLVKQSGLPLVNTVAVGNSGPAVVGLQELLNGQGSGLAADGLFGPGTLASVQGFQKKNSLTNDGVVGPLTWAALVAAQPTPPVPPKPVPVPPPVKTYPAPVKLTDRALSAGSVVNLNWGAVPGATAGYILQVEVYKPTFGWVLSVNEVVPGDKVLNLSPRSKYRWRVAANEPQHNWSPWVQFTTP